MNNDDLKIYPKNDDPEYDGCIAIVVNVVIIGLFVFLMLNHFDLN